MGTIGHGVMDSRQGGIGAMDAAHHGLSASLALELVLVRAQQVIAYLRRTRPDTLPPDASKRLLDAAEALRPPGNEARHSGYMVTGWSDYRPTRFAELVDKLNTVADQLAKLAETGGQPFNDDTLSGLESTLAGITAEVERAADPSDIARTL